MPDDEGNGGAVTPGVTPVAYEEARGSFDGVAKASAMIWGLLIPNFNTSITTGASPRNNGTSSYSVCVDISMVVALVGEFAAGDFSLDVAFCPVTKAIQLDARPMPVAGPVFEKEKRNKEKRVCTL